MNLLPGIRLKRGMICAGLVASLLVMLTHVWITWISLCGSSSATNALCLIGLAAGVAVGRRLAEKWPDSSRNRPVYLICTIACIGSQIFLSRLLDGSLYLGAKLTWSEMPLTWGPAFLVIGMHVVVCAMWLFRTRLQYSANDAKRLATANIDRSEAVFGLLAGGMIAAGILTAHGWLSFPMWASTTIIILLTSGLLALPAASPQPTESNVPSVIFVWPALSWAGAVVWGWSIHSTMRLTALLFPWSPHVAFIAGLTSVVVFLLLVRSRFVPQLSAHLWLLAALAVLLLPPLTFGTLAEQSAMANAFIETPVVLLLVRALPIGLLWGLLAVCLQNLDEPNEAETSFASTTAFAAMGLAFAFACSGFISVKVELIVVAVALGGAWIISGRSAGSRPTQATMARRSLVGRFVFSSVTVAAAAVLLTLAPVNQETAVQLGFNSQVAASLRETRDTGLAEQSTAARMLTSQESGQGMISSWRTNGDLVVLRRQGIPLGAVSTNTTMTPQPIADVLSTVLPLVLHQNPRSVMLLGDETGEGLAACAEFPLQTLCAVRPNSATTKFAQNWTWKSLRTPLDEDDRIYVIAESTPFAVRGSARASSLTATGRFDVVVSMACDPMMLICQQHLTGEFYRAVRDRLNENGVFCQRVCLYDLGAEPLMKMVSTISRHFDRVLVTQMSPGEIAIVAGTSADSLLDEGLLTRLSRSHVSRVLTRCGWDWSQVAALPVVDTNDPVGIFEHEPKRSESLASHGFSAFSLPLEVMRWADKSGELKQTFGPHQLRMADAAPRSDLYAEFARRYSSVIQQQEILTAFPDQPWAYRRSLKMEMQRNPRPPVETIRDGNIVRQANPVDEYRKDYFETLGRVLQMAAAGDADPLSLRQLNRFTFTCEPLISHFAHHELVRIHELTGHQSPALELRHRLHTVYFTEPGDMSVRQVAAALEQILDDPELLPSDEQRFDQTNSLLQQLVVRWQRRQGYEPPSARQTQQDVDHSVSVANRALEKMRTWAAAVGVDEAALRHRRQYVNKALVAPLRTYRDQVLAHRIRTETPTQSDSAIDSDLPLLLDPSGLTTN